MTLGNFSSLFAKESDANEIACLLLVCEWITITDEASQVTLDLPSSGDSVTFYLDAGHLSGAFGPIRSRSTFPSQYRAAAHCRRFIQ